MDFLLNYDFTNEDIDMIKRNNSQTAIKNISMNTINVSKVMEYLSSLGITKDTMRDLFVYQIGMFHRTKGELEQVFEEYEIESIVKSLNYDVNTIDMIEF